MKPVEDVLRQCCAAVQERQLKAPGVVVVFFHEAIGIDARSGTILSAHRATSASGADLFETGPQAGPVSNAQAHVGSRSKTGDPSLASLIAPTAPVISMRDAATAFGAPSVCASA